MSFEPFVAAGGLSEAKAQIRSGELAAKPAGVPVNAELLRGVLECKAKGMTQNDTAMQLGMSKATAHRYWKRSLSRWAWRRLGRRIRQSYSVRRPQAGLARLPAWCLGLHDALDLQLAPGNDSLSPITFSPFLELIMVRATGFNSLASMRILVSSKGLGGRSCSPTCFYISL